jgi:alanine racemase
MVHLQNSMIIELSALVQNLNQVKKLIGAKTRIMGIVKSDAYGHGLVQVSRVLEQNGVDFLGVAHLSEALEIRRNGINIPIVILCGIMTRDDAREVVDKDLRPVVFDLAEAALLAEEAARKGKRIPIQVKIDTGMGRLGIPHSETGAFLNRIMEYRELYVEALASHLSSADEPVADFTRVQIDNFHKAIEVGRAIGLELPLNNLANSAGIIAYQDSHFDMVRPGIILYGGLPAPDFRSQLHLKPVMNFKSYVLQVRDLPDNTPISYGRTYHTKGQQKIAVISAGYADGLPRSLSNRGKALIGGKKVDIVGRICMNMLMCDVSGVKDVFPGTEAVFLGMQGGEVITGDDVARWGETISYEIFCSLGKADARKYVP